MQMDTTTKVTRFQQVGMIDPLVISTVGLVQIQKLIKRCTFDVDVYPPEIMEEAIKTKTPPACIFLPDRTQIRRMMLALIRKPVKECDEEFLFRFSLFEHPQKCLKDAADLLKDIP